MMKSLLFSLLVVSLSAHAVTEPPHIGPVGGEFNRLHIYKIEKLIEKRIQENSDKGKDTEEDQQIAMLLAVGKKASKWIEVVNASRLPADKLDLSAGGSSGGIPMTKPIKSSTEILMKSYEDFLAKNSTLITDVITSSQELPSTPPLPDQEFLAALKTLDRIYSSTIRWAGQRDWISYYTGKAIYDIRGYVNLKSVPNLEEMLNSYSTLSQADQVNFYGWLLGLCRNDKMAAPNCKDMLNASISKNQLVKFYKNYVQYGEVTYENYFTLQKTRPEMKWNSTKTILNSPFLTPERSDVQKWLKENVEDEWRGAGFNLNIDYKNNMSSIPRIEFKEGITAHVNSLGGDLISMEAEYPIETKGQKYTIRHEFGHVLGFQDCYLEFYDTNEKAMIYYEIDVDNIMCSRNGKLKPTHIEQLQKSYK